MFKKVLFTLGLLSLFLLISCNNLIENYHGSNQLEFGIGNAAKNVESAIRSNESINDNTELNVQCELLRGETVIDTQSVTKALKDLYSATFSLDNIPNGNNYYISIKISYNNTVIYDALSDVIVLGEGQEEANVSLQLKQKNSSIAFDLCGGSFKEGVTLPSSYFINSSIVLPVPEKAHNQFDGWYLSKDFAPEKKIESLGKTCFLGDVTLYAKWIEIIDTVVITPSDGNIDYGEKIKLTAGKGANIYYTLDGTDPTEKSTRFETDIVFDDNIIQNDKVTVKAMAVKEGMIDSGVFTKEYTLKRYNVTFNHNGHGILPPNANKTGAKKGVPRACPGDLSETGYTFDGWYGNSDFKGSVFDFDTTKVQTASVDIYAKWTLNPVTTPSFEVLSDGINIKWTNPAASDLSGISITCTEDTTKNTELGSTVTEYKVTGLDSSKDTYTFKIKAKSPGFESAEETVTVNMPGAVTFSEINEKGPTNSKDTVTFDVVVTGKNFNAAGFSNNSFASDSVGGVVPTVTVDSDTQITLKVTVPKTTGTYTVNLKYAGMTKPKTFTVREYSVGDIVYSDGSISKTALTTTATPVAVIFRAKSGEKPALGVGLKQSESTLMWAKNGTKGYTTTFTSIICIPSATGTGAANNVTFETPNEKDTDGSDNWSSICGEDTVDTENAATNYPAFDWVNKYGTSIASGLSGTGYTGGWYMPSIAELCELYREHKKIGSVVTAALTAVGGTQFRTDNYYWSSSQSGSNDGGAWGLDFSDGSIYGYYKDNLKCVCCVRAF